MLALLEYMQLRPSGSVIIINYYSNYLLNNRLDLHGYEESMTHLAIKFYCQKCKTTIMNDGIHNNELNWFTSYLTEREQVRCVNDHISSRKNQCKVACCWGQFVVQDIFILY